MQLHELKSHPVIKALAYAGFSLIIISFVFFYGWNTSQQNTQAMNQAFARIQSDDPLGFLPWRKWEKINASQVRMGERQVLDRDLSLLDPQFRQFIQNQQNAVGFLGITRDEAVRQAVDSILMAREAKRRNIIVTREDAINYLNDINMTQEQMNFILKNDGVTFDQFLTRLRNQQAADRLRNYIAADARVSLYELWLNYLLVKQKITLQIAAFPITDYIDQIEVTDEQLQTYLEEHHEDFRVPDRKRFAYVKYTLAEERDKLDPSAEQLQTYYEQHPDKYLREAEVRVESIYITLADDMPSTAAMELLTRARDHASTTTAWSTLVLDLRQKLGEDFNRLNYGGTRWVSRADDHLARYGEDFVNRAFAIHQDEISTPFLHQEFQTPRVGFIRRLDSHDEGMTPLEEIADQVETDYKDEKARENFDAEVARLKEENKRYRDSGELSLRDFAQDVGLEDRLTTFVLANQTFIPEIGPLGNNAKYIHRLKMNRLSELIPGTNMVVALELVQEKESYLPELDEVRDDVRDAVKLQEARKLAEKAAKDAYEQLRTGEPFDVAAAAAPSQPVKTDAFTRLDSVKVLGSPLIGFMQQSAGIAEGSSGYSPYGPSADNPTGYAIWYVEKLESPTTREFADERRTFERDLLQVKQLTMMEEWLADQRGKAQYELLIGDSR